MMAIIGGLIFVMALFFGSGMLMSYVLLQMNEVESWQYGNQVMGSQKYGFPINGVMVQ